MLSEDLIDRLKNLYENPGELKSTEIAGLNAPTICPAVR